MTLVELSLQKVVKGLVDDTYPLQHRLSVGISNQIYEKIPEGKKPDVLARNYEKLRISKLRVPITNNETFFRIIKKLDLEVLSVRDISSFPFPMIQFVRSLLNRTSKKRIYELDMGTYSGKEDDPLSKLFEILPNLRRLTAEGYEINFGILPTTYENMTTLNILGSRIKNLNGISKLPNLEVLIIADVFFESADDMEGLFELKKLKILDISKTTVFTKDNSKNVEYFSQSPKCLPELTFLDCSRTEIDELMLDAIQRSHPKLKKIGLLGTQFSSLVLPQIECLNTATVRSGIHTCLYFESLNRPDSLEMTVLLLRPVIAQEFQKEQMDIEALCDYLRALLTCIVSLKFTNYQGLFDEITDTLFDYRRFKFHRYVAEKDAMILATCTSGILARMIRKLLVRQAVNREGANREN